MISALMVLRSMKRLSASRWLSQYRLSIPAMILLGTLLLSAIAAYSVQLTATTKDRLRFNNAMQSTQLAIENHIKTHVALLQSGSGLFAASDRVTVNEFRAWSSRLALAEQYPGVQGIGYSIRIPPDSKPLSLPRCASRESLILTFVPPTSATNITPLSILSL
uniref:Uncharacterized protein n=1 Tax=Desertifilum tharense IPPAS B-1220 TaxID=1781255 RepID=A0ACD5H112_9CYAN